MSGSNKTIRLTKKKKRSWLTILFFLSTNMYIVYLITNQSIFETNSYILFSLTMFVFMFKIMLRKKNPYPQKKTSVLDTLRITWKFLRISKNHILTAIIGISIAALIISQTILFTGSYQQANLDNYLNNQDSIALDISFHQTNKTEFNRWSNFIDSGIDNWLDDEDLSLNTYESSLQMKFKIITNSTITNNTRRLNTLNVLTNDFSQSTLEYLNNFPSFSYDFVNGTTPQVLIVSQKQLSRDISDTDDFAQLDHIPALLEQSIANRVNASHPLSNYSIPVDYIWVFNETDEIYATEKRIATPLTSLFLNQVQTWRLFDQFESITEQIEGVALGWGLSKAITEVHIRFPNLLETDIQSYKRNLGQFIEKIGVKIDEYFIQIGKNSFTLDINSPLLDIIEDYDDNLLQLKFIIALMNFPIILVSFYLLNFAFSLLKKLKEQIFYVMMTRGVSNSQSSSFMVVETLISAIIASGVGMLLSIPITIAELRTSGILQFKFNEISLIIPDDWIWELPVLGILLSLNFSLLGRVDLNRIQWSEDHRNVELIPFWQRGQLPLVTFSIALLFWIILENVSLAGLDKELLFIFGFTVLILLIISLPLVLANNFLKIIAWTAKFTAGANRYVSLLIHNLHSKRTVTSQFMAIMFASILLTFLASSVAISLNDWVDEQSRYEVGADLNVEVDLLNFAHIDSIMDSLRGISDIEGIESASEFLRSTYQQTHSHVQAGENPIRYELLGVNVSSFSSGAFWMNDYADQDLEDILDVIGSSIVGVGIQEDERNILDLEIEDEMVINYGVDGVFGETVVLKAEFDFWPNLVSEIPTTIGEDDSVLTTVHLLGSFKTILGLSKILTKSIKLGIYITLDENANANRVIGLIQNKLQVLPSFEVNYYDDPSEGYFTSQQINYLMSTMHGIVIFSIIINIISISYYAFIVITQRGKEFALYSVMGMKNNELKKLILFELMILVLSSLIIGLIASAIFSGMIINLLMSSSTIMATIAIELKYSFVISSIYVLSFILGSYGITRLTIRRLFKKSINNLLRAQ